MKKYLFIKIALILCLLYTCTGYTQGFPGFSRVYPGDPALLSSRNANINILLYDSTQNALYCAMKVTRYESSDDGYTQFFKSDVEGTVQVVKYDTQVVNPTRYTAAATDGQYIYWLGVRRYPSKLKVFKTDMNLEKIWEKEYGPYSPYSTPQGRKLSMLIIDQGHLLITSADLFKTELYKIDSAGNLLYRDTAFSKRSVRALARIDDQSYLVCDNLNLSAIDSNMQTIWSEQRRTFGAAAIAKSKAPDDFFYIAGGRYVNIEEWIDAGYINGSMEKVGPNGQRGGDRYYGNYEGGSSVYTYLDDGYQSVCIAGVNGCAAVGKASQSSLLFGEINRIDTNLHSIWNYGYTHSPGKNSTLSQVVSLPDGSFVASGWAEALDPSGAWERQGWLLRVDSNGCFDSTCSGRIAPLGMAELSINEFKIFPNPVDHTLNITLRQPLLSEAYVYITDISGRRVQDVRLPGGKQHVTVDVRHWTNGIYLLNLQHQGRRAYQKVVIQH